MTTSGARPRLVRALVLAVAALVLVPASAGAVLVGGTTSGGVTVVVDPVGCRRPVPAPATRTVCTPAQAAGAVRDGGTVVLRPGTHRGPLDLRGRSRVTVRGERGAVLDGTGLRFALALRDVTAVRVSDLVLRGGTAQTVWVERTSGVVLDHVVVQGGRGAGVQLRDSAGFRLQRSRVAGAGSAGVMELTGVRRSTYEQLVVTGNGRAAARYDGDGLQLSGAGVVVRDVVTAGNGSDRRYEHGVYVSSRARDVRLSGVTSRGNSGVAVKLGGSGVLERSTLEDEGTALYCAATAAPGWTVRGTRLAAPTHTRREPGCALRRG